MGAEPHGILVRLHPHVDEPRFGQPGVEGGGVDRHANVPLMQLTELWPVEAVAAEEHTAGTHKPDTSSKAVLQTTSKGQTMIGQTVISGKIATKGSRMRIRHRRDDV